MVNRNMYNTSLWLLHIHVSLLLMFEKRRLKQLSFDFTWEICHLLDITAVAGHLAWLAVLFFIMPRHQKVAGYYVIPSEILSVRPSVCLSVRLSVRPSVSAHHHSCIGNSSYSFRPILLKLYRCFKDGLKICILFFQNPEIIFYHFFSHF